MARRITFQLFSAACGTFLLAGCANLPVQSAQTGSAASPLLTASNLVGATPATLNQPLFGQPALLRFYGSAQVSALPLPRLRFEPYSLPRYLRYSPCPATAVPDNGDAARCTLSLEHATTSAALEPPASS